MINKIEAEIEKIKKRKPLNDLDLGRIQGLRKAEELAEDCAKLCCKCKKELSKRSEGMKNICRKCYEDKSSKWRGQISRLDCAKEGKWNLYLWKESK